MSESARSILKHLYQEGRMTEEQYKKIDRNLKDQPHGEWNNTERADLLLRRLYSWKMNNPMLHEARELLDECIEHLSFEPKGSHGNWEYLKEHITEMRDADGELNQKQTCQFILELMGVIEREGDRNEQTTD